MTDPRQRGAAAPLAVIGEGCTRRFDPQALTAAHGADFSAAAALWDALQATSAADRPLPESSVAAQPPAGPECAITAGDQPRSAANPP